MACFFFNYFILYIFNQKALQSNSQFQIKDLLEKKQECSNALKLADKKTNDLISKLKNSEFEIKKLNNDCNKLVNESIALKSKLESSKEQNKSFDEQLRTLPSQQVYNEALTLNKKQNDQILQYRIENEYLQTQLLTQQSNLQASEKKQQSLHTQLQASDSVIQDLREKLEARFQPESMDTDSFSTFPDNTTYIFNKSYTAIKTRSKSQNFTQASTGESKYNKKY